MFVGRPRIPMDNTLAERLPRGPVIGRRLSFGFDSETGARFTAHMYIGNRHAEPNGVDVPRWLELWLAASTAASRLRRASMNCHSNEPGALRAATSAHFNSSARASAASSRSRVCSYSRRHQAFDLRVLHGPAAIPQRRVHAAPAIGGGTASITYWTRAMGIVQVPSETRCASPLTPESVSRSRPTPDA